ncbi:MAG: pyridoxamine 5'-phosphate oxidase family protein [Christensenellaceae bacterium]|nr:pyridoxamine 5'-phosphate oxidase family protein [Christensenellaceae bacterium]
MFRQMRRKAQQLTEAECIEVLISNTSGVLAVLGDDGYPYAVPLSYVYDGRALYFHCAKSGHKLDAINNNNKVSFCVVDQDLVIPQKYTTFFRSVIVFGRASIVSNENEIRRAIERLAVKYYPDDSKANRDLAIERESKAMCMVKIEIEHMTGKEAIELAKARCGSNDG